LFTDSFEDSLITSFVLSLIDDNDVVDDGALIVPINREMM
jgi:hypothetical protein